MQIRPPTWLFLAFLLALGLRFYQLGFAPLNDEEARLALQAWRVAQGLRSPLDSQVLYVHATAALFFVFGPYNFLARFWPALSGSMLVFLPWAWHKRFGERTALFFAFLLALDPGMVALSRQANAWMPVLFSLGMAWVSLERGGPSWSGFFMALALLGGRPFWEGLLFLLIAGLLHRFFHVKFPSLPSPGAQEREQFLLPFFVTFVCGSTLFLFSPAGFGALWKAPLEVIQAWTTMQASLSQMFLVLIGYELLPLLLAIGFLFRDGQEQWRIFTAVSFALPLLFPGHTPNSWLWFLVPLLFLAAQALDLFLQSLSALTWQTTLSSLAMFLLLIFAAFNLIGIAAEPAQPINTQPFQAGEISLPPLRFLAIFGALLVLGVSLLLIALEWGKRMAWQTWFLSVVLILGIYTLGSLWSITGMRYPDGIELWSIAPNPAQAELLEQTVSHLSLWRSGHRLAEEIVLAGWEDPPASLVWLLRRHPVAFSRFIQPEDQSALWISPALINESGARSYRGQAFSWQRAPLGGIGPGEALQWLFFRKLPLREEMLILWASSDLFEYKGVSTTPR